MRNLSSGSACSSNSRSRSFSRIGQETRSPIVSGGMSRSGDNHLPAELEAVAHRMRAEAPEVTPLELDRLRRQIHARSARAVTPRREQSMKSRMAIVAMLVSGLVMSTAGTGLAVTGLTNTDSAAEGQYGPVVTTPAPTPQTPAPTTPAPAPTTLGGPQGEVQ